MNARDRVMWAGNRYRAGHRNCDGSNSKPATVTATNAYGRATRGTCAVCGRDYTVSMYDGGVRTHGAKK